MDGAPASPTGTPTWSQRLRSLAILLLEGLALAAVVVVLIEAPIEALVRGSAGRFILLGQLPLAALIGFIAWRRRGWRRVSRALWPYVVVLVAASSFLFGLRDEAAARIAGVPLAVWSNGIMVGALALLVVGAPLPRTARAVVGGVLALAAVPFLVGMVRAVPLGDVISYGPWILGRLPLYLRPAALSALLVAILAPVSLAIAAMAWLRPREGRRPLHPGLIVWIVVAAMLGGGTVLTLAREGVTGRYFAGGGYGQLLDEQVDPGLVFGWWGGPGPRFRGDAEGQQLWAEWEADLDVPEAGSYDVKLEAPLGGQLFLDGLRLLEEGGHGSRELARGTTHLRAAAVYRPLPGGKPPEPSAGPSITWKLPGATEHQPIEPGRLEASPRPGAWRRTPRQAAQVGLEWLQSAALAWHRQHKCFGCHVQGQALMGMAIARDNDYEVSKEAFDALLDGVVALQGEDGSWHATGQLVAAAQYGAMALGVAADRGKAERLEPLLAATRFLLARQAGDGRVPMDRFEPPIDQGDIQATSNARVGLLAAARRSKPDEAARLMAAAARMRPWLATAHAETNQDRAMRLMGLCAGEADGALQAAIDAAREDLLSRQLPDGGWGEKDGMKANGFATGQALWALKVAGQSVASAPFQKGVAWLLEHQLWTGAWPAEETTSHRPSEFAPTMWAVIALAGAFEPVVVELAEPASGAEVSGAVSLAARVITEERVDAVRFRIDGAEVGRASSPGGDGLHRVTWNAGAASTGKHDVVAEALAGEQVRGEARGTVFTGTILAVDIVEPAASARLAGPVTIRATAASVRGGAVSVRFHLSGAGLAGGRDLGAGASTDGKSFALGWDPAGVAPGNYLIEAVATDTQGARASDQVMVQVTAPIAVRWVDPSAGAVVEGDVHLRFRVETEPGIALGSVELRANDVPAPDLVRGEGGTYTSGLAGVRIAPGPLHLVARAVTTDGKVAEAPLDLVVPEPLSVAIEEPVDGAVVAAFQPLRLAVRAGADTFVEETILLVDGKEAMRFGGERERVWDTRGIPDGEHRLGVTIRDSRGRTASHEIRFRVALGKVELRPAGGALVVPPAFVEIVLDASGSMWAKVTGAGGRTEAKIEAARRVLTAVLSALPDDAVVALRAYGHRSKKDCEDSELVMPLGPLGASRQVLLDRIAKLHPKGMTPIARSLEHAGRDLAGQKARGVVILVSDGIETCEGDPVKAAKGLLDAGLRVKVHVVGFDVAEREAVVQLQSVAAATGGAYVQASTPEALGQALNDAMSIEAELRDAAGRTVGALAIGGEPLVVPAGTYSVELAWDPPVRLDGVVVAPAATAQVEVRRSGGRLELVGRAP